mmetsp:Transcript_49935/g.160491  ORF Transcript_49935/g.160491 Transcript_49935/m.160491 type:complete len:335 (-) Transcript_49935:1459-2463(-)
MADWLEINSTTRTCWASVPTSASQSTSSHLLGAVHEAQAQVAEESKCEPHAEERDARTPNVLALRHALLHVDLLVQVQPRFVPELHRFWLKVVVGDDEAHLHGPARDRHEGYAQLHHGDFKEVGQGRRVAKQSTNDEADQRHNEWAVLRRNHGRHQVAPPRRGVCRKEERDDELPIGDEGLADKIVDAREQKGLDGNVDGVDQDLRQVVSRHVDPAGALAPKHGLVIAEHIQAKNREQQGQACVEVQIRHGIPTLTLDDEAIQDRKDHATHAQGCEEDGTLAIHPPPLHQAAQRQDLELTKKSTLLHRQLLQRGGLGQAARVRRGACRLGGARC